MRRSLLAITALVVVGSSVRADLENQVFTSDADHLRIVVPRGWRASDQPTYPGFLLWMLRDQPEGKIALTAEPFTRAVYCSWPITCRTSHELPTMTARYACALRHKLALQRVRLGPVEAGPKENEEAGVPSVWFEYDDGSHFVRQAVALSDDRAISLVLSAPTSAARATHVRAFEEALRSLAFVEPESAGIVESGSGSAAGSGLAPVPQVDPVGACTEQ